MSAAIGMADEPSAELPLVEAEVTFSAVRGSSREDVRVSVAGSPEVVARVVSAVADAAEDEYLR